MKEEAGITLCVCDDVCSVSASACMSARPECRWAMPAGSCTVWSMASSPTVRCRATRRSAEATTRSTRSSARPEPASTCLEPSSSTLSPLSSVSMPLLSNAVQLWGHVNEIGTSTEMNGGHYITNDLTFGQKSFLCILSVFRKDKMSDSVTVHVFYNWTVLAADRRSRGKRPGNARNRSAIYRNSKTIC